MKKSFYQAWVIPLTALSVLVIGLIFYGFIRGLEQWKPLDLNREISSLEKLPQPLSFQKELTEIEKLIQNSQFEKAQEKLDTLNKKSPQSSDLKLLQARLVLEKEGPEASLSWLKSQLDLKNFEDYQTYAWLAFLSDQWGQILPLEKAADTPKDWLLFEESIQLLRETKNIEKSLELQGKIQDSFSLFKEYQKAAKEILQESEAMQGNKESYQMARSLQNLHHVGALRMSYALAPFFIESYPQYRDLWILHGQAALLLRQWDPAIQSLTESLKIDATHPIASYYLGLALSHKKAHRESIEALERALLYGFQYEELIYPEIAMNYYYLEDFEAAMSSFEYDLQKGSDTAEDFSLALWIALEKLQDVDRAKKWIQLCQKRHPYEALTAQFHALLALKKGEDQEAYQWIQKALQIDPNLPEAHLSAGILLEKQGQGEQARWEYEKAKKLAPLDSLIYKEAHHRLQVKTHAP